MEKKQKKRKRKRNRKRKEKKKRKGKKKKKKKREDKTMRMYDSTTPQYHDQQTCPRAKRNAPMRLRSGAQVRKAARLAAAAKVVAWRREKWRAAVRADPSHKRAAAKAAFAAAPDKKRALARAASKAVYARDPGRVRLRVKQSHLTHQSSKDGGADAAMPSVCRCRSVASSGAAFLLQDDIEDMLDSKDMDVRAEAQALVDVTVNGADTDLTALALLPQLPTLSLQQIQLCDMPQQRFPPRRLMSRAWMSHSERHTLRAGPTVGHRDAGAVAVGSVGHSRHGKARHLACDGGVRGDALGRWQKLCVAPTQAWQPSTWGVAETINSVFMRNPWRRPWTLWWSGSAKCVCHGGHEAVSRRVAARSCCAYVVAEAAWTAGRSRKCRPRAGRARQRGGFGGVGVLLVGDFGQIPPIGEPSLMASQPGLREAAAGQRLFRSFHEAIRQRGRSEFKDSTLRLRGGAMSLADCALSAQHDLAAKSLGSAIRRVLEEEALWLVSQNAQAGSRNGAKLARLAEVREAILQQRRGGQTTI